MAGTQPLIRDCNGFFLDSGGNTGAYGPNENLTVTICPDGTTGTHIQLVFPNTDIGTGDDLCFFDGDNANAPILACASHFAPGEPFIVQATAANSTGCLTITFVSDNDGIQGQGWSAAINCIPACQTIEAILVDSDPMVNPPDTGWIDACPDQRLLFSAEGRYPQNGVKYQHSDSTSQFFWNFGDGGTAVGPDVTYKYDKPGGYIVQLTITDQFGCTNTNFISQRVRISTPPNFSIGGDLPPQICSGDTIALNAVVGSVDQTAEVSVTTNEGSFQQGGIRSDSLALPDGTGVAYETSINFSDFAPGQTLTDVNDLLGICLNIEHSWMRDLQISLMCPDGKSVILHDFFDRVGGEVYLGEPNDSDGTNPRPGTGYEYCWTPTSTRGTWLQYANANLPRTLPAGDYRPFQSFTNLLGCPLNGEWKIRVQDLWAVDNGFIFSWSINFDSDLFPSLEKFEPAIVNYAWNNNPTIFSQTPDQITASPQTAGTALYTFTVTDDFGCAYDTSFQIKVLPYTHPDCYNCAENINIPRDTVVCTGEDISFDVSVNVPKDTAIAFSAYPQYPIGFSNHPPNKAYASLLEVNSINPDVINDPATEIVSVCIDLTTDWASDISLFLRAPSGELLELSSGNGAGGDNYTNTCFTPLATTSITTGTAPFTGNFRPEGNWNILQGADINGNWALLVSDGFGINEMGQLNSWSITFRSSNEISYTWSASPDLSCTNCPNPTISPDKTTTYFVESSDSYGCVFGDSVLVGVVRDYPAPEVSCTLTQPGEIAFQWTEVENDIGYEINLIRNGTSSGWSGPVQDTQYVVSDVLPNETLTLQVRVYTGGASLTCNVETGEATCSWKVCDLQGALEDPVTDATCFGDSDGAARIIATGGDLPYKFYLDSGTTSQNNGNFSGLNGGDHFVVVEDAELCQDTVFFTINQPDSLAAVIAVEKPVSCTGSSDAGLSAQPLGGNGGFSYQWSTGSSNDRLSGLAAGSYSLSVTDSKGCSASTSFVLEDPAPLELTFNATDANCFNTADGTAQAVPSGGAGSFSFSWSTGIDGETINGLAVGTYCVTVTDANGCQINDCVLISSPSELKIDSFRRVDVTCFDQNTGSSTVFASGGTGAYTYSWNDGLAQIAQRAVLLQAGTYEVTVTDEQGCRTSGQVEIQQPEELMVSIGGTDARCNGSADGQAIATAQGGTSPYQFEWNNGLTNASLQNLAAGIYALTVTDAKGCTTENQVTIGQPKDAVIARVEQTQKGCFGEKDNQARVFASGGNSIAYSYRWNDGQKTELAVRLDSLVYTVTVTDANGCTAESSLKIRDLAPINPNMILNSPSCFGAGDGGIGINFVEGRPGMELSDFTFQWSNNQSGPLIENLLGGTTYSVTVTDPQGCSATISRMLEQPAKIIFDLLPTDVRCFGENNGTARVANIRGDHNSYTIRWDQRANNQTGTSATNLKAGSYSVTVTDSAGCSSSNSVIIRQPEQLKLAIDMKSNSCYGDSNGFINASVRGGTGDYSYLWSNGAITPQLKNLPAGNYGLTVSDVNDCRLIETVEVTQPPQLSAKVNVQDVTCFGDRNGRLRIETLGGTPPYSFSLDNREFNTNYILIGLKAGNYNVYVRDANSCLYSTPATILSPPEMMVDAGPSTDTLILGDSLQLAAETVNAAGEVEFVWYAPYEGTLSCTECPNPFTSTQNTITYELYGIDANGCEDTDRITIIVDKPRIVAVPTGFSPNGDKMNDRLLVHGRKGTIVKIFQVFDRWGELLFEVKDFEVNDPDTGWDGTFRGQPMNAGVYIWYLEVEYIDGAKDALKGQTTLIR